MLTFLKLILIELNKRRSALLGWGLGLFSFALMIMSLAPALAEQFAELDLSSIAIYQAFGITESIDSAANLLGAYLPFFGLMVAAYGLVSGTSALAGEEDGGTLELLLALPLPRWAIVLAKAAAIALVLLVLALLIFAGFGVIFPSLEGDLSTQIRLADLYNAGLDTFPIAFVFAMLGLLLGAYLPHRSHALGLGLALLVGCYLFNNLGGTVEALAPYLPYQPFHYYSGAKTLSEGPNHANTFTLLGLGALFLALALLAFRQRNVTVGAWPWQRPRPAQG